MQGFSFFRWYRNCWYLHRTGMSVGKGEGLPRIQQMQIPTAWHIGAAQNYQTKKQQMSNNKPDQLKAEVQSHHVRPTISQ